jgi:hypothetical protein
MLFSKLDVLTITQLLTTVNEMYNYLKNIQKISILFSKTKIPQNLAKNHPIGGFFHANS